MHSKIKHLVENSYFKNFIIIMILINAATLGMETSASLTAHYNEEMHLADTIILWIFIIEIALRIYAHRLSFFTNAWSLFDLVVVGITLVPSTGNLSILRTLRVLRVLRLISAIPSMRRVVSGLIASLSGIASVTAIMLIIYYVFAVMGTKLFASISPEDFGTMGHSMYTLFKVMTLEGWIEIAAPIIKIMPNAWIYFISFILSTSFIILNLFIGVMLSAMHTEISEEEDNLENKLLIRINELHNKIDELNKSR